MKRILSYLVVCALLVSAFAVMNVGAEETDVWALPTDWSSGADLEKYKGWEIPVQGPWSLLGFDDLDTATVHVNDDANIVEYDSIADDGWDQNTHKDAVPFGYVGADHNERKAQKNPNLSRYTATTWYVDFGGRWSPMIFESRDDATGLDVVCHANAGGVKYDSAIVFTAPSNGTYSFGAIVTGVLFKTINSGDPVEFEVTVRKNGTVLTSFVPTEAEPSGVLEGEVELKAGDMLMFAFTQTTEIYFNTTNHNDNNPDCVTIQECVVSKVSDEYNGGEDVTPPTGGEDVTPPTTNPETGDSVVAYVAMAVVALFGIAYVSKKR